MAELILAVAVFTGAHLLPSTPLRMLIAAAGIWVLILMLHPHLFGLPAVWL